MRFGGRANFYRRRLGLLTECSVFLLVGLGWVLRPPSLAAAPSRVVMLSDFTSFRGDRDRGIELQIRKILSRKLEAIGLRVVRARGGSLKSKLGQARDASAFVLIDGFYRRKKNGTLDLYGQLYNPETGFVFDAYSLAEALTETQGIKLPPEERRTPREAITRFAGKIALSIRANPKRRERHSNIRDHITDTPVMKAARFPVRRVDVRRQAEEVFKILGEVKVVTASRKGQRISEAPSNIVVLTREMIRRRGYLTLTEALQDIPYFDFTTFHDGGEFPTNFLLRGLTDVGQAKVLVMEDGLVQNDVNFGWSRNLSYNTTFADVERIEIILGPGSALYGANAYAGLINVITRDGEQLYAKRRGGGLLFDGGLLYSQTSVKRPAGPLAETDYGYFTRREEARRTYGGDGVVAYRFGNGLILQLAGRWYYSDGDGGLKRPDPGNYFHNNHEPEKVQTTEYGVVDNDVVLGKTKRLPDGFSTRRDNLFFRGKLTYRKFLFGFNYWDKFDGLGSYVPGHEYFTYNTYDSDKIYTVHHKGYTAYTSYEARFSRKTLSRTKVYYRASIVKPETGFVYTYRFQDIDRPVKSGQVLVPVADKCKCYSAQGHIFGIEEQLNLRLTLKNELIVGLQLESLQRQFLGISLGPQQEGDSNVVPFTFTDNGPFDATTKTEVFYSNNGALFAQDEQKFLRKYAVTGGVRYDVQSDVDGTDRVRVGGKLVSAGIVNLRVGLVGTPFRRFSFKLLYGEAFKSPTLFELFDEFRGNPNLRPQRIETYEFVTSYKFKKYYTVKASYFFSELQDVIEIRPNDGSIPIGTASQHETFNQNVEATHMYGGTLGFRVRVRRWLFLYTDYSVTADRDRKTIFDIQTETNGVIKTITVVQDGHEIDNIAMRKVNFGVNYLYARRYNFNLRANRVGRRKAPVTNKYFQPYDFNFIRDNYPYEIEGTPDGYMSGYTIWNFTFTWKNALGYKGFSPQIIVRNLMNTQYAGIGRQSGSSVRPRTDIQPTVRNPPGFIPPYHPQPGRTVLLRVNYRF